ncbi:hypothetical protein E4U41_004510 [Claviceps citrina]|nr:hypothetical protein E4U41_004510 [Claviceps citrina]
MSSSPPPPPPPPISPAQLSALRDAATAAKARAYSPYSGFHVGAALLTSDGGLVTGANVENAAYPAGTCAERVALAAAVTAAGPAKSWDGKEERRRALPSFLALGVATDVSPPASPCGMCRQFIREFCSLSMPIYMFDKDGYHAMRTLEELLPMSFGPDDLLRAA